MSFRLLLSSAEMRFGRGAEFRDLQGARLTVSPNYLKGQLPGSIHSKPFQSAIQFEVQTVAKVPLARQSPKLGKH